MPFLHSVKVGDSFPVRALGKLTSATNAVDEWLDKINPLP